MINIVIDMVLINSVGNLCSYTASTDIDLQAVGPYLAWRLRARLNGAPVHVENHACPAEHPTETAAPYDRSRHS